MPLHQLLETLPTAAYTCNAEGLITFYNQHAIQCWGRTPQLNHPADRYCGSVKIFDLSGTLIPHDQCAMAEALRTGSRQQADCIVQCPNGRRFFASARIEPLFDDAGTLLGAVNFLSEVTHLPEREPEPPSATSDYSGIVESTTDLICRFRSDGTLTFVNEAYCKYRGRAASRLLEQPFYKFVPIEDQPKIKQMLTTLSPSMTPLSLEHRNLLPNGEIRWHHWTYIAVRSPDLKSMEYQATGRDITEQKQAQELLQEILEVIGPTTGENFFSTAVEYLSGVCQVKIAFAAAINPENLNEARTIAVSQRGRAIDNITYSIIDTPCQIAVDEKSAYYPTAVQEIFPEDHLLQELGIDSYLGIPLCSTDGQTLGVIAIMDDKPIWSPKQAKTLLEVVATRGVAELERQRAQESLTLFRSLIDRSQDVIEVVDPETGRFLDVNEMACRAHGYTREEYLALSVADIDPLVKERTWKETSNEVRRLGSLVLETQHCRKDGSVFPVEVNVTHAQLDKEYFVTVVRDISERKRAEQALRESEERYKTIFHCGPDALFVISAEGEDQGRIVAANDSAGRIHGCESGDLIGKPITDLDTPEAAADAPERISRLNDGERLCFEIEHFRKDGSRFPVEVTAEGILLGGKKHILAFDRDITDRKQAAEALRASEERLQLAVQATNIGPWDWDLRKNEVHFTAEWKRQLGYGPHELTNGYQEWESRLHPDDSQIVLEEINAYLASRKPNYAVEFRLMHRDGRYRWFFTRGVAHWDAEGRPYPDDWLSCRYHRTKTGRAGAHSE